MTVRRLTVAPCRVLCARIQEFIEETATMPVLLQAFHELLPRPKRGAHSVISVLCDEHDFNFDRLTQLSTFLHREAM